MICKLCHTERPQEEFVKNRRTASGYTSRCKSCERERVKRYSATAKGKEVRRRYLQTKSYKTSKSQYDKTRYTEKKEAYKDNSKRIRTHNQEIISIYKDRPCQDCGEVFPSLAMDLDHVRGVKVRKVSALGTASKQVLYAELKKCDVVCANCHHIRTHKRRTPTSNPRIKAYRASMDRVKSAPCMDCNRTFEPVAMQFDHISGKKQACISDMHSLAPGRVEKELQKCELVCAVCHRFRTESRKNIDS